MFLLGLGLGMAVTASGGAIALYTDARRNKKHQPKEFDAVSPEKLLDPVTHYHITIDEDAKLPDFIRKSIKTEEEEVSDIKTILEAPEAPPRNFDWTKSFPKEKQKQDETNLGTEDHVSKESSSRSQSAKRKGRLTKNKE